MRCRLTLFGDLGVRRAHQLAQVNIRSEDYSNPELEEIHVYWNQGDLRLNSHGPVRQIGKSALALRDVRCGTATAAGKRCLRLVRSNDCFRN